MVPNAFPCDSQLFKFSTRGDLAAEVIKHVTSSLKQRGRDNGPLGAKTGEIRVRNSFAIHLNISLCIASLNRRCLAFKTLNPMQKAENIMFFLDNIPLLQVIG